jgi:hypothetical protein
MEKELPKYKSHKEVWALKIKSIEWVANVLDGQGENREADGSAMITPEEEGFAPFKVDQEYMQKHKPQVGGYYVEYEDGYASWSPREAFESGYTKCDFETKLRLINDWLVNQIIGLEEFLANNENEKVSKSALVLLNIELNAMRTYQSCLVLLNIELNAMRTYQSCLMARIDEL